MATTIPAILAQLGSVSQTHNCSVWSRFPPVPAMTAAQRANAITVLLAGTVANEADALTLLQTASMVSGVTPASVTCTLATPAVLTWTTHGFQIGQSFMFIGGTAATGTTLYTPYYIITAGFGASSFQFSLTSGGAAINTSSTGTSLTTIPIGGAFPMLSQKAIWDLMVSNPSTVG